MIMPPTAPLQSRTQPSELQTACRTAATPLSSSRPCTRVDLRAGSSRPDQMHPEPPQAAHRMVAGLPSMISEPWISHRWKPASLLGVPPLPCSSPWVARRLRPGSWMQGLRLQGLLWQLQPQLLSSACRCSTSCLSNAQMPMPYGLLGNIGLRLAGIGMSSNRRLV